MLEGKPERSSFYVLVKTAQDGTLCSVLRTCTVQQLHRYAIVLRIWKCSNSKCATYFLNKFRRSIPPAVPRYCPTEIYRMCPKIYYFLLNYPF